MAPPEALALARLGELDRRLAARFDNTVLASLGAAITQVVAAARAAVRADPGVGESGKALVDLFNRLLWLLPETFGSRFCFDHWILTSLLERLARTGAPLSPICVPIYGSGWGYTPFMIPSVTSDNPRNLHLYRFAGDGLLEEVDLRSYRWVLHEIAHAMMRAESTAFRRDIEGALSVELQGARSQLFSLKGEAKRRQAAHLDRLEELWQLKADQEDWAHEIAMDVLAIRLGGPCYARLLHETVCAGPKDLFTVEVGHPPFAVRVLAARLTCEAMGHSSMADMLDADIANLIDGSEVVRPATYGLFVRGNLVRATVAAALRSAGDLGLPTFDPSSEDHSHQADLRGEIPDDGLGKL